MLKLITGNIRIGVSARLAKTALADGFGKNLDQIEQIWNGLAPPYQSLFAWLEGNAEMPVPARCAAFLTMMLSHPIEDSELEAIDLLAFQVEPKWDGVRVQLARSGEHITLYSRTGDDMSETFPDIVEAALEIDEQEFVLDGELLTKDRDEIALFNALQQRLNIAGRPRGHWFKWKRNTLSLDCVLLYAQRGSGKRSSFYSDYTFGVWHEGKLLPIGKTYSGFTDEELFKLDKRIRANTINRFGPVGEVKHELVFEIEFDSIHKSSRHKSGLAMRFPRVQRIRWDKPAVEADSLENARMLAT